jgi:hypothetical protein
MRRNRAHAVLVAGLFGLWLSALPGTVIVTQARAMGSLAGPREAPNTQPSAGSRSATGSNPATGSRTGGATPGPTHTPKIPPDELDKMPDDATGFCGDKTWTMSATKQGACSGHSGVSVWLGPPPHGATGRCKDGTYTHAKQGASGACSSHGGLKFWKSAPKPPAP